MNSTSLSRMRLRSVKRTIVVLLAAMACDVGVTPPAEVPTIAMSLREVRLFAPAGSDTPDTASVVISNNGRGSLEGLEFGEVAYQGAESGWLSSATVNDTTLRLSATAAALATGTYSASIDAQLAGASNSPRKMTVTFEVGRTQSIDLSSNTLAFGATAGGSVPPAQVLSIANGGEGTLFELNVSIEYPPSGQQDWLDSSLASTVAPTSLTLTPTSVLPPGMHSATVIISSRIARPQADTVDVSFEVTDAPQIFLSADQIDFVAVERSTTPITKMVSVAERLRRNIDFANSTVSSSAWLDVSLDTTVTPAMMTLRADPAGLDPIPWGDSVVVTSAEGGSDTLTVVLAISQGPAIALSPDTVRFAMARTGPLPDTQYVSIENDSSGTLTGVTVTPPAAPTWLSASPPDSATAPTRFALWVDSTNFTPGEDTANVVLTGDGTSSRSVTAVFAMTQGPAISLSSDLVEFYAVEGQPAPAGQSIAVSNGGDGVLTGVEASSSETWLTVDPTGPRAAPVEFTLTPDSLDPGAYTAIVTVISSVASNTPTTISVTYNVAPAGAPSLALSPDSVRFTAVQNGPLPSVRVIEIENIGGAALTVDSASDTAGWLSVSPKPPGNPTMLELSANTAGYAPGVHIAQVSVWSSDPTSPHMIPAVLTILPAPTIEFSTDLVRFRGVEGQGLRPDLAVAVTNGSNGALSLVPPPTRPNWLQSAALQGTAAPTELTLTFNTGSVSPGTGTGTVSVGSAVASPAALDVEYAADPFVAPLAAFSPHDTVRFTSVLTEALPAERVVEIENVGGGTLSGLVANGTANWLSASLDGTSAPTRLRLNADTTGYAPGTYATEVEVVSNSAASPDTIPVEFTILPGPRIAPSVDSVTFRNGPGNFSDSLDVLIWNAGGGALSGLTATDDSTWLTTILSTNSIRLIVTNPPLSDAVATLTLGSSVAGIADTTIVVAVERLPSVIPATIGLSSDTVRFTITETGATGPQVVWIENRGGGTVDSLNVNPPAPPGLTATLSGITAPADLTLAIDTAVLSPGTYDLQIQSSTAPTATLTVEYTLLPGPELALSSDSVTFYADSGQALPISQAIAVSNGSGGALTDVRVDPASIPTWLTAQPTVPTAAPVWILMQPADSNLAPATYTAALSIESPVASNSPVTIDVIYVVGPPAVIGTSSDNINFTTARHEPVPTDHVLMIENLGGGTLDGLNVTTDPPASAWLDPTLNGTTAPATLSLTVLTTDPAAAPQPTELVIASPVADTVRVPVSYTVLPGPALTVSSDTVRFYSGIRQRPLPEEQVVAVSNQSAGTLSGITITVSPPSATWLEATLGSAPTEVTLQPNTSSSGLILGTNTATVSISSPVSSASADIAVEYTLGPGAEIALSTDAVQFVATPTAPDPAPRDVVIENAGTGTLDSLEVNPATVPGWLLQANISPTTAPATLTLTVDPAGLSPGNGDTVNLEIISPAADTVTIPVSFTVLPGPSISPSASELEFRAVSGQEPPDTQTVTVLNGAGGTLSGVYVDQASIPLWLDATPKTPAAAPTTIEVWPRTTDLTAGDSVATLQIMSNVASNSPVDLTVTYRLAPGPVLSASPAQVVMTGVSGSSDTDVQTVLLENVSAGTLRGLTVGNTPSWLSTSLDTTDAPAILTLTANPQALPVDTASHTVTVSSNDAANTADIAVTFVVSEPTTLSLSPQTVVFNSIAGETSVPDTVPDAQTVSIINTGSGQLRDVAVAANQSWLTLSLDTSSVPATVTVQPNQVLESRSAPYTADIEVMSSTAVNSPRTAYVEYYVQPPAGPVIRLSPQTLTFARDNPPAQIINITNGGSGTLRDLVVEVSYQAGNDWLFVLLDTRVAPAKLTVSVVTQNAASAPANAEATIRITGEGAAAQEVTVRLP